MGLLDNELIGGWYNTDLFFLTSRERTRVKATMTNVWVAIVDCVPIFTTPTPWLFLSFAKWTVNVTGTLTKTLENVVRWQDVIFGVPILIAVARWGRYAGDFRGLTELIRGVEYIRWLSPPVIGEVGPLFLDALARDDPLGVRRMVATMDDGELCLMALQRMLDIDWDAICVSVPMKCAGLYLY